jgi:hypothetical protein
MLRRDNRGHAGDASRQPFDDADAGHGSLVVEQAIEHHALMLDFARRVLEGR